MTTLLIILFYTGIVALVILGILLIDNLFQMLYWMWINKYHKTNTQYEAKKIGQHKKSLFIILPIMLTIISGMFLYNLPIGFEEIMGNKEPSQVVEKIYARKYGNGEDVNKEITNKNEISDILDWLIKYKYERNLEGSSFGNISKMMRGKEFIELDFVITGSPKSVSYISLNITDEGIIYDGFSGKAFKVKADNERQYFNQLLKTIFREIYPIYTEN